MCNLNDIAINDEFVSFSPLIDDDKGFQLRIISIKKVIDIHSGKILEYVEDGIFKDDLIKRYKDHPQVEEICTNDLGDVLILFNKLD